MMDVMIPGPLALRCQSGTSLETPEFVCSSNGVMQSYPAIKESSS